MKITYIRQGDLLFKKVMDTPKNTEHKKLTIAEGEQTGHHHVLLAETDSKILGDRTLFAVKGRAKLIHPEHDTIEFNSGTYVVLKEREFDYVDETLKEVRD